MRNTFESMKMCMTGIELAQSGKMQNALGIFDKAIEIDPLLACSWFNKGYVLSAEGRCQEALEAYERAIEINPSFAHPWNGKGYMLSAEGRHNEALEAYKIAIQLNPTLSYAWNGAGNSLYEMGRHQEALEAYQRAIELDPAFANPWCDKASLLKQRPELEAFAGHSAQQSFCRAIYLGQTYTQKFPLFLNVLIDLVRTCHLPLIARQLLLSADITADYPEYSPFYNETIRDCEVPLSILFFLNHKSGLSNPDKQFWGGVINYYFGNPIQAFERFDAVDSEDETDLAAQYYLILTLSEYLEPSDNEKEFALRQAEAVLKNPNSVNTGQLYYAGRVFFLAGDLNQALLCFARNSRHLPSLYMQWLCLHRQNESKTDSILNAIMEEEYRLVRQGTRGYLFPVPPPEIDPAKPDWIDNIRFYVHLKEIEPAVLCIVHRILRTERAGPGKFPVYNKIVSHMKNRFPSGSNMNNNKTWNLAERAKAIFKENQQHK